MVCVCVSCACACCARVRERTVSPTSKPFIVHDACAATLTTVNNKRTGMNACIVLVRFVEVDRLELSICSQLEFVKIYLQLQNLFTMRAEETWVVNFTTRKANKGYVWPAANQLLLRQEHDCHSYQITKMT